LGPRAPGVAEIYAEFSPDYLSKRREGIDGYFGEWGVSLPMPNELCVSVARNREIHRSGFSNQIKEDGGRDRD